MSPIRPLGRSFRTSRAACPGSTTVLNGIFWILRSGAPWRDLPESFGPYTTCYNRFVRWRMAGIWDLIMEALAETHDSSVRMIDTSIVRVHQHGGCARGGTTRLMGRSRGGLTTKIHACVERFFNRIKQCRRVATRYDKLAANYLAFIKLAAIRIWLRAYESTP